VLNLSYFEFNLFPFYADFTGLTNKYKQKDISRCTSEEFRMKWLLKKEAHRMSKCNKMLHEIAI